MDPLLLVRFRWLQGPEKGLEALKISDESGIRTHALSPSGGGESREVEQGGVGREAKASLSRPTRDEAPGRRARALFPAYRSRRARTIPSSRSSLPAIALVAVHDPLLAVVVHGPSSINMRDVTVFLLDCQPPSALPSSFPASS
ncbi:hypothetical protein CVT26_008341 [Gymnopilus dilepis]|uniref:Uncharacterized protein n=1 Tax=Gymnopilus dilepis TaxID=231916 RepID=A0A409XY82_9AGAR|nr:hypothetical protein CVT26_008341 [Gymnopilus dilepis]